MRHAFDDLGFRRYEWKCDSLNAPSRRAALRLGFIWEGRFRNAVVYKGRNRDTDWFSITDGEWPRVRAALDAWLDDDNFDDTGRQRTRLAARAPRPARRRPEMDQRVSFITLVVTDLDATRRFYVDGLGWDPEIHVPGEVLMFKVADKVVLSLWTESGFVAEVGQAPARGGVPPVTLSHNLATAQGVDTVLEQARAAGASQVGEASERDWGGYSGYFADPDGFRWEVAYNPGEIGQSVLP